MSKKRITIPVFIPHSGCPHCCVFCNQWKVTGLSGRVKPGSIHATIGRYLSAIPRTVEKIEIAFFGGSFTAIPEHEQVEYLSEVKPYIENGTISSVRISTRPDYIDNRKLDLLKEYHVETVELGVQSFSDEVLTASGRGHTARQVTDAVALLKDYRFRTGIQLMPGLPSDTFERSVDSAKRTVELLPDDARIYPAVVLKDTAMERLYIEQKYRPLSIEQAVDLCSVIYGMFSENGINVIRMGLHPMDLSGGSVVAGPYHEALGFMIKSRYRRRILENIIGSHLEQNKEICEISILLPDIMKEEYIGMKRENILYLEKTFHLKRLQYKFSGVEKPEIL